MKPKLLVIALVVIGTLGTLGAGSYGLYRLGLQRGMGMTATGAAAASSNSAVGPTVAAGKLPQSVAEGEEATRRHIQTGIKAGLSNLLPGTIGSW